MALNIMLSPLALEQKKFSVGDKIRVTASLTYTVGADTTITVQAGPYHYIAGILDRIGSSFGSTTVSLPKAVAPAEKSFTIDFTLKDISAGTYGLIVEIPGTSINAKQDDLLVITGAASITDMLPMMMMMMMMGMIMPMMEEQ